MFFLISGFVIPLTLERTRNPLDYIMARFSRLYPAYWISVAITFFVVMIFTLPGREVSTNVALLNLTMLQGFLGVAAVDGVYWILSINLTFYAIMFFVYVIKQTNHLRRFAFAWVLVTVLNQLMKNTVGIDWPGDQIVFLQNYVPMFMAGTVFYKMRSEGIRTVDHMSLMFYLGAQWYVSNWQNAAAMCAMYLLFYLYIYDGIKWLAVRPLLFVGGISYSLYLIHQNVGYVILRGLYGWGLDPLGAIPIAVVGVVIVATGITYLIERPASRMIRRRYRVGMGRWMDRRVSTHSDAGVSRPVE
ncbi:MAG: acyltransferase [Actinobacteria bacterium]|nr:acyltransferase [Actinomycetota bacterium]